MYTITGPTPQTNPITLIPITPNLLIIENQELQDTPLPSPFEPLDCSPKNQLYSILKRHGLIDENCRVIKDLQLEFSLDSSQIELLDNILQTSFEFEYKTGPNRFGSSCTFTFKELFSDLIKQTQQKGCVQVNLIGGIVRRLFTLCKSSCASLFESCNIPLPKDLISNLLKEQPRDLPDIDIRFDFEKPNEKVVELLDQTRRFPVDFVCKKLDLRNVTTETLIKFSLNKWALLSSEPLLFSVVNFCKGKFSFSNISSSLECMFVSQLASRYLFSRDNLTLNIASRLEDKGEEVLKFQSVNGKQLETILHILLGKVLLENTVDSDGFIRMISLFVTGETLANPFYELKSHKEKFLEDKGWYALEDHLSFRVSKCLKNHYPNQQNDASLIDAFMYHLLSLFPEKQSEIILAWQKIHSGHSPLFNAICVKKMPFKQAEAALGLAALFNMSRMDMEETSPQALLCNHGQKLFLQLKLPEIKYHILIPFKPQEFINTLKDCSEKDLVNLFYAMSSKSEKPSERPSLLQLYRVCHKELFTDFLIDLEEAKSSKTPILKEVLPALKQALTLPKLRVKDFAEKICLSQDPTSRVFWYDMLVEHNHDSLFSINIQNAKSLRETFFEEPFRQETFISNWVTLLTHSKEQEHHKLAMSLLEKNQNIAKILLQNNFTTRWICRLFKIDKGIFLAQKLLAMLQKRQKCISPETERNLITQMLRQKERMGSNEKLASCKILQSHFSRVKQKEALPVELFEFIDGLITSDVGEARKLLFLATEHVSSPQLELCQQSWIQLLKNEVSASWISPEITYQDWLKSLNAGIWKGAEKSKQYAEVLLALSGRLITGSSPVDPEKGFELLKILISLNPEKEVFEKRIKQVFNDYLSHLIKEGSANKETLKLALIQIQKHASLLSKEESFKYFLKILSSYITIKSWKDAETLCGKLLSYSSRIKFMKELCEIAEKILLFRLQKGTECPLIDHKNFYECIDFLDTIWSKHPMKGIDILKTGKNLLQQHKSAILKKIFEPLKRGEDLEMQKKFLTHPVVLEQKAELDCSSMAAHLIENLLRLPQKHFTDCIFFFKNYLDQDAKIWISLMQSISHHENIEQAKIFFMDSKELVKDPQTLCKCYIWFLEFLVEKKDLFAKEISLAFSEKESILYAAWKKSDKETQTQILNLLILAEMPFLPSKVSESKEYYVMDLYEQLQSLTQPHLYLQRSEHLLLKHLLQSDLLNDYVKGLFFLCNKLEFQNNNKSLQQLKQLASLALERSLSWNGVVYPNKQMSAICEFVCSFVQTDFLFFVKSAKILSRYPLDSIGLKINRAILILLSISCQHPAFVELIETHFWMVASGGHTPSILEATVPLLRTKQFEELLEKNTILLNVVQKISLENEKQPLDNETWKEKFQRYFGLFIWMAALPEYARVWQEKILDLTEKSFKEKCFTHFFEILNTELSDYKINILSKKNSHKNQDHLPLLTLRELPYCNIFNELILKTMELQNGSFSKAFNILFFHIFEKMTLLLKAHSFPSDQAEKFANIVIQYCSQCTSDQRREVYDSLLDVNVVKYHQEIFLFPAKKLLESTDSNDHCKALFLMKALVCLSKEDEKILVSLFEKMADRAIEFIIKTSSDPVYKFISEVTETIVGEHLSRLPPTHQAFLLGCSFRQLEKQCLLLEQWANDNLSNIISISSWNLNEKSIICIDMDAQIRLPISTLGLLTQVLRIIPETSKDHTESFFKFSTKIFSYIRKKKELFIKEDNVLKEFTKFTCGTIHAIYLLCKRNRELLCKLEPMLYKELLEEVLDWTQFLKNSNDEKTYEQHRSWIKRAYEIILSEMKEIILTNFTLNL